MDLEQVVPKKRSLEPELASSQSTEDTTQSTHHYSTRSTTTKQTQARNKNKNVTVQPKLKILSFDLSDCQQELKLPTKIKSAVSLQIKDKKTNKPRTVEFHSTDDHPFNSGRFKYKPCRPNPDLVSNLYSTTDLPPYQVRLSYFDRANGSLISDNLMSTSTAQGWRSCRTNVGIREGRYYMEFNILNSNEESHVRIGVGRKEASLEAPVGFDGYGYALRDKTGQKIHLSRPADFMKESFGTGDVIGLLLELPSSEVQKEISEKGFAQNELVNTKEVKGKKGRSDAMSSIWDEHHKNNIVRDQIPIKYKSSFYFEQYEYTATKNMSHLLHPVTVFGEKAVPDQNKFKPVVLPDSRITVFKNGVNMGVAFENLYAFLAPFSEKNIAYHKTQDDGSLAYYPMISTFKKGCAELNPGPEFTYVPESLKEQIKRGEIKCLNSRYNENVCDNILWDIIDDIEVEYLDSFR